MNSALERKAYRKRMLLGLLTSPVSLIPFVGGATLLIAAWALGLKAGLTLFAGLVGVVVGIGTIFTRWLTGSEKLGQRVVGEMRREAEAARQRELDQLERELTADGDSRTEKSLRELRVLAEAFRKGDTWAAEVNNASSFDIISGVDHLFATCVTYLRTTLQLWRTAQGVESEEARQPMLEQRERLIKDVRQSIRHISSILARTQTLGMGEETGSGLTLLREELDASLAVAKRVQDRIAGWGIPVQEMEEFGTQHST